MKYLTHFYFSNCLSMTNKKEPENVSECMGFRLAKEMKTTVLEKTMQYTEKMLETEEINEIFDAFLFQ